MKIKAFFRENRNHLTTIMVLTLSFALSPIFPSPAHPETPVQTIKVLILDENFPSLPEKDPQFTKIGSVKGDLLVEGIHYSGDLEVWKGEKGLYIINELPLEFYVENVVAAEVGTDWEIEALKAQAVISRTYAVYKKNNSSQPRYHITSSVLHQVYKGNNSRIQISYAVRETEREILTYSGVPIEALYHSTCGGKTENAEEVFGKSYPYLKSVESNCELSPFWVWERKIPVAEIEKALSLKGIKGITINAQTTSGRAKNLSIDSETGQTAIKATDFRKSLGWSRLPSTFFTVAQNQESYTFEGRGYGHGVGLCQWSALQMARDGRSYREILSFFYPGTEIRPYEGN